MSFSCVSRGQFLTTLLILILFMMAAFRKRSLPNILCRAQIANFEVPRLTICVVGVANGRLSLEVMRFNRSRRFFFCRLPEPSPSTSACGRNRLDAFRTVGGKVDEEKLSLVDGSSSVENEKLSCRPLDLPVRHSKSISTRSTAFHSRHAGPGDRTRRNLAVLGDAGRKGTDMAGSCTSEIGVRPRQWSGPKSRRMRRTQQ